MLELQPAAEGDWDVWHALDAHLPQEEFIRKAQARRAYLLWYGGEPVGVLRYQLLWDHVPFLSLLLLRGDMRRRGLGRAAMAQWERELALRGHGMALTSTQVDEQAQHFYRRLGYRDIGGIVLELPGYEQPMELFMAKALTAAEHP